MNIDEKLEKAREDADLVAEQAACNVAVHAWQVAWAVERLAYEALWSVDVEDLKQEEIEEQIRLIKEFL